MRRCEEIQLIGLNYASGPDGDTITDNTPRIILAERKSVQRSEFYQAMANAIRPTVIFEVWAAEYADEPVLQYNGARYRVVRTFSTDIRHVELTCEAIDLVQTDIARLHDTVEIWKNSFVENSMREQTVSPVLMFTVPARVESKGGGTSVADGVVETINNVSVTIRYREGVTPDMFLKINGQRFDIQYIEDPFNRHEMLILTAERVVP